MITIKRISSWAVLLIAMFMTACTDNFEEINTDPDNLEKVSPGTLLNPTLYGMATFGTERSEGFAMDIMQVRLPWPSASEGVHRYVVSETAGNSTWNTYYRWLTNINEMKAAADTLGDKSYQAVALTLRALAFSQLTDCFGSIPMREANLAEQGVLRPVFDSQEEVYKQLLTDLDTANSLFAANGKMIYGTDLLYANDVSKWRRFCNSLHLRLLLRISKRTETNAFSRMAAIINNPDRYPIFTANDQAAIFKITGETPNISPWGRPIDFTNARCAAEFFVNTLNDFNDPRRARWLSQAKALDNTTLIGYKGIPAGYAGDESQFDFMPSNMNIALGTAPMASVIMTYAEVEFIIAELAQRGVLTSTDAQSHYEKGVKASIEQWGATLPADYFNNDNTRYNGTLERIMLQKYIALFFNDYQQWFEYRRTGLPVLPKGDGMLNGKVMPVRFKYPPTVQTTNYENYKAAVAAMGGDDINTKVWWEK